MTTQQRMQALKLELDDLDRQQSELVGATKQEYTQLKALGFDSVESAIAGVKTLNSERAVIEGQRDAGLIAYERNRDARLSEAGAE